VTAMKNDGHLDGEEGSVRGEEHEYFQADGHDDGPEPGAFAGVAMRARYMMPKVMPLEKW